MTSITVLLALLFVATPFLMSPLANGFFAELWLLGKLKRLWRVLKKKVKK